MSCNNCEEKKHQAASVPYFEAESQSYRANRTMRYMATVFCVAFLIIALVIGACLVYVNKINQRCVDKIDSMNRYWIDYISQYDFESYSYEYSQDGRGLNIIGNDNEVHGNGSDAEGYGQETNP